GIKSESELLKFSELGAKYSKVFKLNNEESINFMSKLSNIYKLNTKDMQNLGDKIIGVAKASNVSASSVAKIMNEVGGDAKLIGMSAEGAAALSAALASATKDEGEAIGTFKAMTSVMSNLNNASDDMKTKFLS
ncbi:phage tail tape measure protein, partial [Campylobacter jejuni]|nr:phage tail tape measure protein [Campylobacter jejuni]MBX1417736.1 phage tail tape measure protein [Campylobacter jejuni]